MDNEDNVTQLPSGVRRYGQNRPEPIEDFPVQIGDSEVVMVREPDAGTVMDIEEATTTRAVLQLFFGDDYAKIEEQLNGLHPTVLVDIAGDLSRHFKLNATQTRVNRAERRRQQRAR
ncbi:hypothetical protein [Nocardia phage KYD2]|nr:hypothetical protein [Nocardia phage KYD2]